MSRLIVAALVATVAFAGPVGASASDGELDPRLTPPAERPVAEPSVSATVDDSGVRVSWDDAPANAVGFEVVRTAGGAQATVTPDGFGGSTFVDRDAPAGDVTYAVGVTAVRDTDAAAPGDAQVGDVLGAVTVNVPGPEAGALDVADDATERQRPGPLAHPGQEAGGAAAASNDDAEPNVGALDHFDEGCLRSGALDGSETWSSGDCPDGYFLVGDDVVVEDGDELTIDPGTTVYFDLGSDGDDEDGNSEWMDLIVRGTLTAAGSSAAPVVFTSIDANPFDTAADPAMGDWGSIIFVDGGTGSIDHAEVVWGSSITAIESTPSVSDTVIRQMWGGPVDGSALEYLDVPNDSTISLSGLTLHDVDEYGVGIWNRDRESVTVDVTDSDITANYPVWVVVDNADMATDAVLNVTDSTLRETDEGAALGGWVYQEGSELASAAVTEVTPASVTFNLDGATVRSPGGDGFGLNPYSESDIADALVNVNVTDSSLATYYNGIGAYAYSAVADASVDVAVSGSEVTANSYYDEDYEGAVDAESYAPNGSATTAVTASGSELQSNDGDAVAAYAYADEDGGEIEAAAETIHGVATVTTDLTNTSAQADDDGVYMDADGFASSVTTSVTSSSVRAGEDGIDGYADGNDGGANATATLSNASTVRSAGDGDGEDGIDLETYEDDGDATTTATVGGGSQVESAGDDAVDLRADSDDSGDATTLATVSAGSEILSGDNDGIESEAYAGEGAHALSRTVVDASTIEAYEDAIDGYADGESGEVDVQVTDSSLTSGEEGDKGINIWADSWDSGDAINTVTVTDSTVLATGEAVEANTDADGVGNASTVLTATGSTLQSLYRTVVDLDAYAGGDGDATADVVAKNATIRNTADDDDDDSDGVYVEATSDGGSAQALGTYTNSTIRANDDAVQYNAYSNACDDFLLGATFFCGLSSEVSALEGEEEPPAAVVSPTFTDSSLHSVEEDGVDLYAYAPGGEPTMEPVFTDTTIQALDQDGLDLSAFGGYLGAVIDPMFTGGAINSGDGIYLYASDWSLYFDSVDARAAVELEEEPLGLHVGGAFTDTVITAPWDHGVDAEADTYWGNVLVDTKVVNTPVDSYDGLNFDGYSEYGDVRMAPEVTSTSAGRVLESYWGYGVEVDGRSWGGTVTDATVVRNMAISSEEDGINIDAESYDDDATLTAAIRDNLIDERYDDGNDGVELQVYAGGLATLDGAITGNTITGRDDHGIDVYVGDSGDGSEAINLEISRNTVNAVSGDGIHLDADGATGLARIMNNVITQTGEDGIDVDGVDVELRNNRQARSGADGISVSSVPGNVPSLLECNTVVGNITGIRYSYNPIDEDPVTNLNNFKDAAGLTNAPRNFVTDNAGTTNLTNNWWGLTDLALIDQLIENTGDGTLDAAEARSSQACRPRGGGGGGGGGGTTPTTGKTGDVATEENPLQVAVTSPAGGAVTVELRDTTSDAPEGFNFFGQELVIEAPTAPVDEPLELVFRVHDSQLGEGEDLDDVVVFRDNDEIGDCADESGDAVPDPCVADRQLVGNEIVITVLSTHASVWNLGVALAVEGVCAAALYTDVPADNVHREGIDCVTALHIAKGVGDGRFGPSLGVTRGQMATFIANTVAAGGAELPEAGDQGLRDIAGSAHADSINRVVAAGIAKGQSALRFAPDDTVTRDQMATFLVNAATALSGEAVTSSQDWFGDDNGNIHEDSINGAREAGIVSGTSEGSYSPARVVTRDQMATFLMNLLTLTE